MTARAAELRVNGERLLHRIRTLGAVGRDHAGTLTRLAGSDADRAARDTVVAWMRELELVVEVDAIGNIFGSWPWSARMAVRAPVMIGSHLDTVVDAGMYDGAYGVLAGLEVIQSLREAGTVPRVPLSVAAFTNEEGVRYAPDMMGSLVHAGLLSLNAALNSSGADGTRLGEELARIGYAGALPPGAIRPSAFLELHIEQGPVLDDEGFEVAAVEGVQGISWQRLTVHGEPNHAGTTPLANRRDAGYVAARIVVFLRELAERSRGSTVATVGSLQLEPNAINVVPGRASLTVDLRDPDDARLAAAEEAIACFVESLAQHGSIEREQLARVKPVVFDVALVNLIEAVSREQGLRVRRLTSGAGHDAQLMAHVSPAAMIFVPSHRGLSHSPREHTRPEHLIAGANVLLGVTARLIM